MVSLQWVVAVKVVEVGKSLNLTTYDNELIHTNEVEKPWNETEEEDTIKNGLNHMEKFNVNPTKFDQDISQFTHTDDKNLHRIESEKLVNNLIREENNYTGDSMRYINGSKVTCIQKEFEDFIDKISKVDEYNITDSVQIVRDVNVTSLEDVSEQDKERSLVEKVHRFARSHVLKIHVPTDLISPRKSRTFFGCKYYQRERFASTSVFR